LKPGAFKLWVSTGFDLYSPTGAPSRTARRSCDGRDGIVFAASVAAADLAAAIVAAAIDEAAAGVAVCAAAASVVAAAAYAAAAWRRRECPALYRRNTFKSREELGRVWLCNNTTAHTVTGSWRGWGQNFGCY
jgi:hypothetical protein